MTETLKKVEIVAGDGQSVELAEVPGKHEIRIRIARPGEWASIKLTREQFQTLVDQRFTLEVR